MLQPATSRQHKGISSIGRVIFISALTTLTVLCIVLTIESCWSGCTASTPAAESRYSDVSAPGRRSTTTSKRTIFNTTSEPIEELAERIASGYNNTAACGAFAAGSGWGAHTVCAIHNATRPCYFYSFGIANDYSFDVALAEKLGCFGFAADPTVNHQALLSSKITFHHLAAKSYHEADNRQWMFVTSMPGLRKWLGHDRVAILKADCEGCEYSIARDVLQEDPDFFNHVDQFAVEVHYSRKWLKGKEEWHSLATLLQLLKEAGLELIEAAVGGCAPEDQATGLVPEIEVHKEKLKLASVGHCHNYLFARLPKPPLL